MKIAIIGGGAIGLSLAWELAGRSHGVTLIDESAFGRKASWAGAGVLYPANFETATHPIEQLEAISNRVHKQWADQLMKLTGIDNGYRECGGLYVAASPGEVASLVGSVGYWHERNVAVDFIDAKAVARRYPDLCPKLVHGNAFRAAYTPQESQICSPRHLEALESACKSLGVQLRPNCDVQQVRETTNHVAVTIASSEHIFDAVVWACGAWTQQAIMRCMQRQGPDMVPVRGQMLLYFLDQRLDLPIINKGNRYIVPRDTGHVLVGATIEKVGFDETTTEEALEKLTRDAHELIPALTPGKIVKSWAGLRPGTWDAFPYMGKMPACERIFVSTGHFKTGLQLSAGASLAMADLIEEKTPEVDMTPFDPSRVLI